MAGSNGILKIQGTNREGQIEGLKTRGPSFFTEDKLVLHKGTIEANEFLGNEIYFDTETPSSVVLASVSDIFKQFALNNKVEVGAGFYTTILNTDGADIKTLNLPTGMTYFDTGLGLITFSPTTRVVLFSVITSITGTPTITAYTQSYSGMVKAVYSKQGAIPFSAESAIGMFNNATEKALWHLNSEDAFVPGMTTAGRVPPFYYRNVDFFTDPTSAIFINFPLRNISRLLTNSSSIAGTVVTSVKLNYVVRGGNCSFGGMVYANACNPIDPVNYDVLPVINIPSTSNLPLLKPAADSAVYEEIVTLNTAFQLTENNMFYACLYSPPGGMPNTDCGMIVFGGVFYVNYQYTV